MVCCCAQLRAARALLRRHHCYDCGPAGADDLVAPTRQCVERDDAAAERRAVGRRSELVLCRPPLAAAAAAGEAVWSVRAPLPVAVARRTTVLGTHLSSRHALLHEFVLLPGR